MTKQIFSTIKVLALALTLSLGLSYVYSWTGPTAQPPAVNVDTPINIGATPQTKVGGDICTTVSGTTKCLQSAGGTGLPSGVAGQTLRNTGGTNWATSTTLFNNGTNIGIDTLTPGAKLEVNGGLKISNRFILPKTGAWSGDVLEVHTSGWDGSSNSNYGTVVGGHGYYYGGLQSGGASGNEAAAGELYVSGKSTLYGQVVGPSYGGMLSIAGGGDGWYGIGQSSAAGGATAVGGYYPYAINMHTGLALSAHSSYGGIRFYNQPYPTAPMSSVPAMQIINNNVGIGMEPLAAYKLDVSGNVRASGLMYASGNMYSNDYYSYATNTWFSTVARTAGNVFAVEAIPAYNGFRTNFASHGLGGVPTEMHVYLVCASPEAGYSVGDYIESSGMTYNASGDITKLSLWANATDIGFAYNGDRLTVANKVNGQFSFLTPSKWTFKLFARRAY